jgi:hypothetical protein
MLGSLIHYRALFGHTPTTGTEVEDAIETVLRGIATDYSALLGHSQRLRGDHNGHHVSP